MFKASFFIGDRITEQCLGTDKVDQKTFVTCERLIPNDKAAHDKALARQTRLSRDEGIDVVLEKYDVNVLIVPSESSKATRFAALARERFDLCVLCTQDG